MPRPIRLEAVQPWIAFALIFGTTAYAVVAEDLTLATYYPSPRGIYQELQTMGNAYLAQTNSGNVGIGTTTPQAKLAIVGGDSDLPVMNLQAALAQMANLLEFKDSGGATVAFVDNDGNFMVGRNQPTTRNNLEVAGEVAIGEGYAGQFTAPENGLLVEGAVGISTPDPAGNLQITDEFDATLYLTTATNLGPASHLVFQRARGTPVDLKPVWPGNVLGTLQWQGRIGSQYPTGAQIQGVVEEASPDDFGSFLAFSTREKDSGLSFFDPPLERMRIDSRGRVGIGTSAPAAQLHIVAANPGLGLRLEDTTQQDTRVLMSDDNGVSRWATGTELECALPVFVGSGGGGGVTGNNGGYVGMDAECGNGAHMCTSEEIARSYRCGVPISTGTLGWWFSTYSDKGSSADCQGWTAGGSSYNGNVWKDAGGERRAKGTNCSAELPIMCCRARNNTE